MRYSVSSIIEFIRNPVNGFTIDTNRMFPQCPIEHRSCPEDETVQCTDCPPQILYFFRERTNDHKFIYMQLTFRFPALENGKRTGDGYIDEHNPSLEKMISLGYIKREMLKSL
jgi:hypothetical protein